ncbi:MAG: hypothetical protein MSC31_09830 [Solirubrobacteraceae bacterium MAG38_C4-C5]|nr:hypothetical protein [Candidatus Siliceabacter maunaloa]
MRRFSSAVRITLVESRPADGEPRDSAPFCVTVRIGERLGQRVVDDGARWLSAEAPPPRRLRREPDPRVWNAPGACRRVPANFDGAREARGSIETAQVGPDTSELRVGAITGTADRIKRAAVRRTRASVQIKLVATDNSPVRPGVAETTGARFHCVDIRIGQRVGDRRIVDAASDPGFRTLRFRRERDPRAWAAEPGCRSVPVNFYGED